MHLSFVSPLRSGIFFVPLLSALALAPIESKAEEPALTNSAPAGAATPPAQADSSEEAVSPTPPPIPHAKPPPEPLSADVESHLGIEYASVTGKNGKPRSLKLDLYVPKGVPKPMPVIVWIHGGGWVGGIRGAKWIVPTADNPFPLTKNGFAVATVDYRLSYEAPFPAQIEDCKAAIRWVRAHAGEYGLNPDKIGAGGSSAGGHLVALVGTTGDDPTLEGDEGNKGVSSKVSAVCDFFGPTDFLTFHVQEDPSKQKKPYSVDNAINKLLGTPVDQDKDKARQASPLYHISAQTCPFFIVHGDEDPMVPVQQSIEFNEALQKAGVASTLDIVKGGRHGVTNAEAFQKAIDFYKHYLQKS